MGSDDGYLYVLNENTGTLIWKQSLGGFVQSSPAVADGQIFVGSYDDKVHAFVSGPQTPTKIEFSLAPNPALVGQTVTVLANLTVVSSNLPISGATLSVKVNGSPQGNMPPTNSTGWTKLAAKAPSAGTFNVTLSYAGSTLYLPSSASKILTVNKASTEIYARIFPNPVSPGAAFTLKGVIMDQFGNVVKPATVSLQVSSDYGVTWTPLGTMTTDAIGIFSRTLNASAVGLYIYRTSYAGSQSLNPTTTDAVLIVR